MNDFTLPMQYARQIAELVAGLGVNLNEWLAHVDLTEAALAEADRVITYAQFRRLTIEAIKMAREPALGLLVGERLRITSHGMLGFAAMNSASLRQALLLLEAFMHLRFSIMSVRREEVGQNVRLHFQLTIPVGELEATVLEAVVLTVKNLLDHISMGSCQISLVSFTYAEPSYAELARDLFKCDVRYGQRWNGFLLPLEVIDQPLTAGDPASFDEAARICRLELERRAAHTSLADRVRRIMLEKQSGFPSLLVTARLFNMTSRTLHRRLIDEGTSYQTILDEVRHMLAVQYLRSSKFSIQEIAFNLGYTDPANFRRAFKRWKNMSPSEYIARHKTP